MRILQLDALELVYWGGDLNLGGGAQGFIFLIYTKL